MKNSKLSFLLMILIVPLYLSSQSNSADLSTKAEMALKKGVAFFHTINAHGGYVYYVTPDLSRRWGEGPKDQNTIEVQPPGTPAVGQSFLNAYLTTGDANALNAALDAAYALIDGQNQYGGWEHTINFAEISHDKISFDDNQTQSAVSFLMALDQEVDDEKLSSGVQKALNMMTTTQLKSGAWPHIYPEQGNYHDYATFNDGGINDCIRVMIEAYEFYGDDPLVEKTLKRAARFMNISQLAPPQSGWAQQYNEYLQPAWARTFEPASVCPLVTALNISTIIDLYVALEDKTVLEPIPDAIRWLNDIKMENGLWGRFIEIGTGKTLYYDRPRIRVNTLEELHPERRTGYRYEVDIQDILDAGTSRYQKAIEMSLADFKSYEENNLTNHQIMERLQSLEPTIHEILNSQNSKGAWITKDDIFKAHIPRTRTTRWNGEFEVMDRISSEVFNKNVTALCEYIDLSKKLTKNQNIEWILSDIFQDDNNQTSYIGNPQLKDSPYGKSIYFDGIDDGIYLDEMPLDQFKEFTIEMIFNPDKDAAPFEQRIVHIGEVSEDRMLLEIRAVDGQWYFDGFVASGENKLALIEESLLHPLGEWHHVALVVEEDKMTTYVNGRKELSEPYNFRPIKTGKTSLGVRQDKRSWFKGSIYKVILTSEALNPKDFMLKK